jgi:chromate transporter
MISSFPPSTPTQKPSLARLFMAFLRLGMTSFGGPAMVAYVRKMAVERKGWLSEASFRAGIALCQTIPGATAMQSTAYVGLRSRGLAGAAVSFVGFGLPAFLIMTLFSAFYQSMYTLPAIVSVFNGLQVVIVAIIANATLVSGRNYLRNWREYAIAALAAILFGLKVHPILVICLAGFIGVLLLRGKAEHPPITDLTNSRASIRPILLILLIAVAGLATLFIVNRKLFDLATLMLRIDLFAFGGGFAALPLMYHEVVNMHSWMSAQTFMNGIALGQVTPGPIVITATFVGYLMNGLTGAIIATVSIFLPSFLLVVGVTPYFDKLNTSATFNKAIGGVLCSFAGLLLSVTLHFAWNIPWDAFRVILAAVAFTALIRKVDILWVVLIGAIISAAVL